MATSTEISIVANAIAYVCEGGMINAPEPGDTIVEAPVETPLDVGSVEALLAERGFSVVDLREDRRSSNKFLGSDRPKSKINPNGYDNG